MRKSLFVAATAAATAMMVSTAAVPAWGATTTHVLTTNKVGGTNVAAKATVEAGLKKGQSLSFGFSLDGLTVSIACTKATIAGKITTNPADPGSAALSLTKQTASTCTATVSSPGLVNSVQSVTFTTPNATTIGDATGLPVTVTAPVVTFTVNTIIGAVTCGYSAPSLSGTYTNIGSVVSFSNQPFNTLQSGSNSACPTSGLTFSSTYGPLTDQSIKTHPHVFVN